MKKLYNYLFLAIFYMQQIIANTLDITNLTSGQLSITLQTTTQTISQTIPVNLNPILNDVNEPDPNPTTINFDNSPIKKISIMRLTPNMPQIIYYDGQNTTDSNQNIAGVKNLSMTTRQSKMLVWKDYVEINNAAYSLNNLDSYTTKANKLKDDLTATNIDTIQKELDDLTNSTKLVRESDLGPQLSMQINAIQAIIDTVANNIKIMKSLQENLRTIQDLQNNLSLGNNNLTGTNKPYKPADDSLERTQTILNQLQDGLKTTLQSNLTGVVAEQAQALQAAINTLQVTVDQMKVSKSAINYDSMMVQPATNLQTYQNT